MANILIVGDSWGIGTYEKQSDGAWTATGQGIQSILEAKGHRVTNISLGGSCNWHLIDRLNMNVKESHRYTKILGYDKLVNFDWSDIDYVVFLQTDIFRENYHYGGEQVQWRKYLIDSFVDSLLEYQTVEQFAREYFAEFYTKLNLIGVKHGKQILCVGGWSQLHPSIHNYTNLVPVVASSIKLLLPSVTEDWYLNDPEWFTQLGAHTDFMKKFSREWKQLTINSSNRLEQIYKSWNDCHPTIQGYTIITEHIESRFG